MVIENSDLRIGRGEELFFTAFFFFIFVFVIFIFFLFFFFLLTVSDDVGETLVVDHGFTVDWSNSHHTVKFVLGETIGLTGKKITEVVLNIDSLTPGKV